MIDCTVPRTPVPPARVGLGLVAIAHLGAVVFTEGYRTLPAVIAAYSAAWWIVRQDEPRDHD